MWLARSAVASRRASDAARSRIAVPVVPARRAPRARIGGLEGVDPNRAQELVAGRTVGAPDLDEARVDEAGDGVEDVEVRISRIDDLPDERRVGIGDHHRQAASRAARATAGGPCWRRGPPTGRSGRGSDRRPTGRGPPRRVRSARPGEAAGGGGRRARGPSGRRSTSPHSRSAVSSSSGRKSKCGSTRLARSTRRSRASASPSGPTGTSASSKSPRRSRLVARTRIPGQAATTASTSAATSARRWPRSRRGRASRSRRPAPGPGPGGGRSPLTTGPPRRGSRPRPTAPGQPVDRHVPDRWSPRSGRSRPRAASYRRRGARPASPRGPAPRRRQGHPAREPADKPGRRAGQA